MKKPPAICGRLVKCRTGAAKLSWLSRGSFGSPFFVMEACVVIGAPAHGTHLVFLCGSFGAVRSQEGELLVYLLPLGDEDTNCLPAEVFGLIEYVAHISACVVGQALSYFLNRLNERLHDRLRLFYAFSG